MQASTQSAIPAHLLAILSGSVKLPERANQIAQARVSVRAPVSVTRAPGYLPEMPEIEAHDIGALECNTEGEVFAIGLED